MTDEIDWMGEDLDFGVDGDAGESATATGEPGAQVPAEGLSLSIADMEALAARGGKWADLWSEFAEIRREREARAQAEAEREATLAALEAGEVDYGDPSVKAAINEQEKVKAQEAGLRAAEQYRRIYGETAPAKVAEFADGLDALARWEAGGNFLNANEGFAEWEAGRAEAANEAAVIDQMLNRSLESQGAEAAALNEAFMRSRRGDES